MGAHSNLSRHLRNEADADLLCALEDRGGYGIARHDQGRLDGDASVAPAHVEREQDIPAFQVLGGVEAVDIDGRTCSIWQNTASLGASLGGELRQQRDCFVAHTLVSRAADVCPRRICALHMEGPPRDIDHASNEIRDRPLSTADNSPKVKQSLTAGRAAG